MKLPKAYRMIVRKLITKLLDCDSFDITLNNSCRNSVSNPTARQLITLKAYFHLFKFSVNLT